jgi:hypothetical protein
MGMSVTHPAATAQVLRILNDPSFHAVQLALAD